MNIESNSADYQSFKITFSNLHCKINISESTLFAFVIRIGKTSSKYTQKKQILNGTLEFDSTLELPINNTVLAQQGPTKKQKCEIMLYKFRLNREKQSKELVGMASVTVSEEMFQVESKKLRLTNSFDKDAFVQCGMKIELGQADILSHQMSQVSSFQFRSSGEPSINNELTGSRAKQFKESTPNKNHVKIGLVTSNSRKSLREESSQKAKSDNSFLDLLRRTQNEPYHIIANSLQPEERTQIVQSIVKIEQIPSLNQQIEEQNTRLKEICRRLEKQNKALKATVQTYEIQTVNQSWISNKSFSSEKPTIPRPGGISNRSPMIKKNTAITVTPSFSKLEHRSLVLAEDIIDQNSQSCVEQMKQKGPKKGQIIRAQASKTNNSQSNQIQISSFFGQTGSRIDQTSKFFQEHPLQLTFAGERLTQRNRFSVTSVIQVKYIPAINYQISSNEQNKSIAYSSISQLQRKNSRSYSKFNGKKKYQIVGVIKNNQNDNSQINMSGFDQDLNQQHKIEGGSILIGNPLEIVKQQQKTFHFNNPKSNNFNEAKPNGIQKEKNFLNFLIEKDQNFIEMHTNQNLQTKNHKQNRQKSLIPTVLLQTKRQNSVYHDRNGIKRSIFTLEDLDIKTEEMFRRNERDLKISNMKITEENRKLKGQKKTLEKELQHKKGLSHEEYDILKKQINQLKHKIQQSIKIKQQSETKCAQITTKFTTLEQQNAKLKKDLKQQKAKYDYYFKMSNINDDKDKERENIGPWEKTLVNKKSSSKIGNSQVSSPIEVSKILARNDRSMTSISNFNKEDGLKQGNHEAKSNKKTDSSVEKDQNDLNNLKKNGLNQQEISKPPSASTAVSKLKMHGKAPIPKSPMSGILAMMQSPVNSAGQGNIGSLLSGLIGSGQTVVEGRKSGNFF